jgi:predicted ATPase/DNA-binding SARP family transcriptional activator
MARLALSFLGPFEVTLDGVPITAFDSNKVRALLAYLAVEADRPHSRDALAGLLWPDYPERSARTNLRNALANLRKAIADQEAASPYLTITRETIQFNRQSDQWTDATAFAELAALANPSHLEEALALYHAPFLDGFAVADSAPFEDWSLRVREQLERQVVSTLERLAGQYEERGEIERALEYARRQVDLAPWQEEAHRRLMRLLALSGARSAALAQYEACCRALREELDVEPGEETARLYERIRDGEDLRGTRSPKALQVPETGSLHNLPIQLTPFVGREDVLAGIEERLQDPNCRLLTLVGPGGSGKTRLALEAAARQVECYRHGAWFVPLAPLRAVESIVPTIAQSLGLSFHGEIEPKAQLLDYLRGKSLLLVLDNAEHLIWEPLAGVAGIATEILKAAPGVKVLVTSRAGLHVQGEHRYPIDGMAYPTLTPTAAPRAGADPCAAPGRRKLDDAAQYSALKLFVQSARRAQPDFELTDEVLPDVVRVCQLVEGMPLGILLAAAWIQVFAPGEIAAQIRRNLDFLESDERDAPERQRSLRAAFDYSWNLLDEREREVLAALSVFRGGFAWEAAQHVASASARELMALVEKSLLYRTLDERYGVHELLQQYAAEKLATSLDAERAVRDRHAAYYAATLERWAVDLKGPKQQAALTEMESEIEDARAAWDWAVEQGQVDRLAQAMQGLGLFYDWHVRYEEGEAAFRAAAGPLAATEQELPGVYGKTAASSPATKMQLQVRALAWQSFFCTALGRAKLARRLLQQGLSLLGSPGLADQDTRLGRAFILREMGWLEYWSGNREEATDPYVQSLTLFRALHKRWEAAGVLCALGQVIQSLGEFDQAKQLHQEALSIRRAEGDSKGTSESLWHVAWALQSQGQFEQAERLERESVALCRDAEDRAALAEGLYRLSSTLGWQGKFREAHSLLEECLVICSALGLHTESWASISMGGVKTHLGEYKSARIHLLRGLSLAQGRNQPWGIAMAFLGLGILALAEGRLIEAQRLLHESAAIFRKSGQRSDASWPLLPLASVALALGEPAQGRQYLSEALSTATDIQDAFTPISALPVAALFLADLGEKERAVEIYALASRYPRIASSRLMEDIAGRHIAAIAEALPPEVVAAAQERGRARDVWATVEELLAELEQMESESR